MTPQETERMMQICRLLQTEEDPAKFGELCAELNILLAGKRHRLGDPPLPSAQTA